MGSTGEHWTVKAARGQKLLDDSIPKQWLIPKNKLPPSSQINIINLPKTSGLLSERELTITETDATGLVKAMAAGKYTAEAVTIGFLKRATIGHQFVWTETVRSRSWSFC